MKEISKKAVRGGNALRSVIEKLRSSGLYDIPDVPEYVYRIAREYPYNIVDIMFVYDSVRHTDDPEAMLRKRLEERGVRGW